MKTIGKKLLTGTIAAGFLLGGGLTAALTQAQAQDTDTNAAQNTEGTSTKQDRGNFFKKTMEFREAKGSSVVQQTATILGVEQSVIKDELKQGKTLAQIAQEKASLSEADFLAKLTAAATAEIDKAVTDGKLTQEQADKQKANLSDRLTKEISNTGKGDFGGDKGRGDLGGDRGKGGHFPGGKGPENGHGIFEEAATVIGVEQSVILDELKQGKTLAQIAQEKAGLSQEDLIAKLTAAETASIDEAVTAGKLTQEEATKKKEGIADRVKKMVENGMKFGQFDGFGKRPIGSMASPETLATVIGITKEQLTTELQAGKSLVEIAQANGITEDQLISKLKDSMTDTIKQFVESKGSFHFKEKAAASTNAAKETSSSTSAAE
ncbi:hypothetical protein DVH26_34280 [Paenibacillus sp. H1-7]|uniref:hypothetical protein n=1 Tax=Paenibacillus sp. H1-7 TaxID=2282849 RepID=UPI001EF7C415|nr:hypothetical protein [Paenibacillus sp. H1-7]ULL19056.1 hypothetical protein DVH26_34280 [Paenibacillus sp. H1-7]